MVTSQTTEIQAEGKVSVDEAVKEILAEMEAEEQDPIEGMGNAQVAEISSCFHCTNNISQTTNRNC